MDSPLPDWRKDFGLTVCEAASLEKAIPPQALGVAVITGATKTGETVYLVIESRSGSLLSVCQKRLQSGKLPPASALSVAYSCAVPTDATPDALKLICRQQVIQAAELRRRLRPSMR